MPSNFLKKEQKSLIEEKYIFKKIFLYSKERNKSTDLLENNDDMAFKVLKEEEFYKNQETNSGKSQNESNNKQKEIKEPYNIMLNLIDEISCRGLDNVGATSCMIKYK